MAQQSGNNAIGAYGNLVNSGLQAGQNEYNNTWGNWGNGLGIVGSLLGMFSDEKLKKYQECSKKVVMKTPSKIQALKFEKKEK
jgi:hypothetical protein